MRCPACQAENDDKAGRCTACGAALPVKPRRRASGGERESLIPIPPDDPLHRSVLFAYRCTLWGLIPFVGLLLGPLGLLLSLRIRRRAWADPGFKAQGQL